MLISSISSDWIPRANKHGLRLARQANWGTESLRLARQADWGTGPPEYRRQGRPTDIEVPATTSSMTSLQPPVAHLWGDGPTGLVTGQAEDIAHKCTEAGHQIGKLTLAGLVVG
jgi:hypothetical protein